MNIGSPSKDVALEQGTIIRIRLDEPLQLQPSQMAP